MEDYVGPVVNVGQLSKDSKLIDDKRLGFRIRISVRSRTKGAYRRRRIDGRVSIRIRVSLCVGLSLSQSRSRTRSRSQSWSRSLSRILDGSISLEYSMIAGGSRLLHARSLSNARSSARITKKRRRFTKIKMTSFYMSVSSVIPTTKIEPIIDN